VRVNLLLFMRSICGIRKNLNCEAQPQSGFLEWPSVTVLKPVCGLEKNQKNNLCSACLPLPALGRNIMKFRLIFLAAFVVILCSSRPSESRSMADIFKEVNGSVTVVVAEHKFSSVTRGIEQRISLGSVGSGVLVSKSGKMITSAHLVHTADQIKVKLSSGEIVSARVAASAPFPDISLLRPLMFPSPWNFSSSRLLRILGLSAWGSSLVRLSLRSA